MQGPNTEIDLDAVHQSILDAISGQFPALVTVADYREDRKRLPLPAVLVELADLEAVPEEDPGTGQLAIRARFEARVIIGFRAANAEREIRKLSGALGAFVHHNRWGQKIGPAEVLAIGPDSFDPDLDQYVVWAVEWQQIVHLGQTAWTNDGEVPETVLYSWSPEIGPEHEADYASLDDLKALEVQP